MRTHFLFACICLLLAVGLRAQQALIIRLKLTKPQKPQTFHKAEIQMPGLNPEEEHFLPSEPFNYYLINNIDLGTACIMPPLRYRQPFRENAIYRPILYKVEHEQLLVAFSMRNNVLNCDITGNDRGRTHTTGSRQAQLKICGALVYSLPASSLQQSLLSATLL